MKVIARRRRRADRLGQRRRGRRSPALEPSELAARARPRSRATSRSTRAGRVPGRARARRGRELLDYLAGLAFNGLAHTDAAGPLAGRLGERVAARASTGDSPRYARTLPRAFDAEGCPRPRCRSFQDGRRSRGLHDTRSAARAGAVSTGHALEPGGAPYGPVPRTSCSPARKRPDEAELMRRYDAASTSRVCGTSMPSTRSRRS